MILFWSAKVDVAGQPREWPKSQWLESLENTLEAKFLIGIALNAWKSVPAEIIVINI